MYKSGIPTTGGTITFHAYADVGNGAITCTREPVELNDTFLSASFNHAYLYNALSTLNCSFINIAASLK